MSCYVIPNSATAKYDLPFEEYKALDLLNQSFLKTLVSKSPMHALHQKESPDKSTAQQKVGTLWHSVLFGEIDPQTQIMTCPDRRGTKAWDTAENDARIAGCVLVKPKEREDVMSAYALVPDLLKAELKESKKEVTILFDLHMLDSDVVLPCKARIDIMGGNVTRDYKTTSKGIDERSWKSEVGRWFYDMQAAFYTEARRALEGKEYPYQWIVQETKQPSDIVGYTADEECMANGRSWMNEAVRIYAECVETGFYKPTWDGKFREIGAPDWHLFEPEVDHSGVKEVTTL